MEILSLLYIIVFTEYNFTSISTVSTVLATAVSPGTTHYLGSLGPIITIHRFHSQVVNIPILGRNSP